MPRGFRHALHPDLRNESASCQDGTEQREPCPVTGYACEGDLSYLCEEYGCARKGGLSPRSEENF